MTTFSADDLAFGVALDVSLAFANGADRKDAPAWIPLLPSPGGENEIVGRDGRRWTLKDPAAVVAHFADYGADLPLDLEHATHLKAPKGEPAPAQAWIKEMQVRGDRSIWGRVEWTPSGLASWASGGWKYVSPGILHDDAREIFGLASAGLVTRPALHLPALARSADDAAAMIVDNAIAAGMLARASRDHWLDIARSSPEKLQAALAAMPFGINKNRVGGHWGGAPGLTSDQINLCSQMGLTEGAFAATLIESRKQGGNAHGLTPDQVDICSQMGLSEAAFVATLNDGAKP